MPSIVKPLTLPSDACGFVCLLTLQKEEGTFQQGSVRLLAVGDEGLP